MEVSQAAKDISQILEPFIRRLGRNTFRANQLLKLAKEYSDTEDSQKKLVADDLLRTVVVFLHATLEDALRSLALLYLPLSSEDQLNAVPLLGTGTGRPEKFYLGRLAQHRGKTIDALLELSVAAHLAHSNYNDTTEVASLLTGLGMARADVANDFSAIDQLMKRRHQIVHRADMYVEKTDIPEKLNDISQQDVETWIVAVKNITTAMMAHIIDKEMKDRVPVLRLLDELGITEESLLSNEKP